MPPFISDLQPAVDPPARSFWAGGVQLSCWQSYSFCMEMEKEELTFMFSLTSLFSYIAVIIDPEQPDPCSSNAGQDTS